MTDQVTAYDAYSPQTARLYESFWTPSDRGDSHDVSFYVDAQRNVTASTAGPSETFESVFSDKYVWPYDAEVYCAVHTPSHCATPIDVDFFLARMDYAPGEYDPARERCAWCGFGPARAGRGC